MRLNFSNEIGSVAGSTYLKTEGSISRFSNLYGSIGLNLHGSFARSQSLNGGSFPIFESYYGGGPNSLRGFAQNTLGPTSAIPDSTETAFTGGKLRVLGGVEISAPVHSREDMHVLTFLDFGNVFGDVADLNAADLRSSVGIGIRWDSPVGPLSVNLAHTMNTQLGDQTEKVQFTLGASF
jgi:outer membrane protein insertion porin family